MSMQFSKKTRFKTLVWEMKARLVYTFFSLICAFTIAYLKSHSLLYLFVSPYLCIVDQRISENQALLDREIISNALDYSSIESPLQAQEVSFAITEVSEAFTSTLLVTAIFSFSAVLPFLGFQCFAFFSSSMYKKEFQSTRTILLSILILWFTFILEIQLVAIPKICAFFLQFQTETPGFSMKLETKIYSYVTWALQVFSISTSCFLILFILFVFLLRDKIDLSFLSKNRRLRFLIVLISISIVSPPDLITEFVFAGILTAILELLLFVLSIRKQLLQKSIR